MSQQAVPAFDRTLQESNLWLKEIARDLHPTTDVAYHALRGVMFTLRDDLTLEEAVDLTAQLPLLIRGVFFEGYRPSQTPAKIRDQDAFLQRVESELAKTGGQVPIPAPQDATKAVLRTLQAQISAGEAEQIRTMLHKDVQKLWPEAA